MKKIITFLTILAVVCFVGVLSASAGPALSLTSKMAAVGGAAGFGTKSVAAIVGGVIQGFLMLLGVIFMAYMVYAGYLWMTARGNEESITKAKAILRGSIVGLIIVLGAYAISIFVVSQVIKATGYGGTPAAAPATMPTSPTP